MKIAVDEKAYYDAKPEFVKLYKRLKLKWNSDRNGWFNSDNTSYILRLDTSVGVKQFEIENCDDVVKFFNELVVTAPSIEFSIRPFVGADLWANRRTQELLKDTPINWDVKW